jgi:5-methylcytosine-specific restriction endonuclease McrA
MSISIASDWFEKDRRYKNSREWTRLRAACFTRDGHACVLCGRTTALHCHHRRYRAEPRHARLEDVTTLCRGCHYRHHEDKLAGERVRERIKITRRPECVQLALPLP